MLLLELFDTGAVKWEWWARVSTKAKASFTVGKIEYVFIATNISPERKEWEIEFRTEEQGGWGSFNLTGTGNSQQVMTTVVSIIKDFLKFYDDKVLKLSFYAKEESRRGLYAKMVHRLIPNWDLAISEHRHHGQRFVLTKKDTK